MNTDKNSRKLIGIGISDFRKLIEGNCLFIDKSLLVAEVVRTGAEILLIPRPRRFGKTLNLSMLRCFLERHDDAEEAERARNLFNGLAIRDTPEFEEHFGRYPVIFLTFKDVKERNFEDTLSALMRLIRKEVMRHAEQLPTGRYEDADLNEILDGSRETGLYREALQLLSETLCETYSVPAIILIDEYDTPIHAAWQYGYYDEMISFMRGLLSAGLKDNPHIYKGVITGILRVAKESIFSDLNNLAIYTILEEPFSDKFGITPEEARELFVQYGMEERLEEADSWYNGYRFGSRTIFNPWSILNFVDRDPAPPEPYWANTSSNALIKELISVFP